MDALLMGVGIGMGVSYTGTSVERINPPFEFKGPGLIHFHVIF